MPSLQVVELNRECDPLQLIPFNYSSSEFAVLCTQLNVHLAEVNSDNRVKLQQFKYGVEGQSGVFVESNKQLVSVSHLGKELLEKYSYHTAQTETLDYSQKLDCLDGSDTSLIPLHSPEMFLLQCATQYGQTLYTLSLNLSLNAGKRANGVPVHGEPSASTDGSYISMVNTTRVVSYNQSLQQPIADMFASPVTMFEFLSPSDTLVITDDGKHYVLSLSPRGSQQRMFPGRLPVKWLWVNSSNHYLYITQTGKLYIFNETSNMPEFEPKIIVDQPELLLFAKKYVAPTSPTQDNTESSTNSGGNFDKSDSLPQSNNVGGIVGGVLGGTVLVVFICAVVGVGVGFMVCHHVPHNGFVEIDQDSKPHDDSPHRVPELSTIARAVEEGDSERATPCMQPTTATGNSSSSIGPTTLYSSPPNSKLHTPNPGTPQVTTIASNPVKPEASERDLQQVTTAAKQILSPAKIPKHMEIQTGKTTSEPTHTAKKQPTPPPASPVQPPAAPAEMRPNKTLPFAGNVSYQRTTTSAESAFGPGEQETSTIHRDTLTS